ATLSWRHDRVVQGGLMMAGFPSRLPGPAKVVLAASEDSDSLAAYCKGLHDLTKCRFGNPDAPITYAVVGDSHAGSIRPAIEASGIMGDAAGTLYFLPSCPLLDGALLRDRHEQKSCTKFKEEVFQQIEANPNLQTIILAGRWPYPVTGRLPEFGGGLRVLLTDQETEIPSIEENAAVVRRSLVRTLDRLSSMGLEVIIIGSTPEVGFDVPHAVAMALYAGIEAPRGIPRETVEQRAGLADTLLADIIQGRDSVRLISIWSRFCDNEWCKIDHDGIPIYHDEHHLSYHGAITVAAPALKLEN
ncbi:MAG: SGNH hydrolase domain-containing protein, partial [Rhodovulum sp.]